MFICNCKHCGREKKYSKSINYNKNKDKPCRSCANSFTKGGNGNVKPIGTTKMCIECKEEKDLSNFYQHKSGNYHSYCSPCKSEKFKHYQKTIGRFKRHGITIEDYNLIYESQSGKCKICAVRSENLYIDHNHKTMNVRGLLCRDCNSALGLFRDNTEILKNAIEYLNNNNGEEDEYIK